MPGSSPQNMSASTGCRWVSRALFSGLRQSPATAFSIPFNAFWLPAKLLGAKDANTASAVIAVRFLNFMEHSLEAFSGDESYKKTPRQGLNQAFRSTTRDRSFRIAMTTVRNGGGNAATFSQPRGHSALTTVIFAPGST